jgi:BlaI family penicillinase repressor
MRALLSAPRDTCAFPLPLTYIDVANSEVSNSEVTRKADPPARLKRAALKALKNSLAFWGDQCVTVGNTMDGNTSTNHDPAELGELERSVLLIVWRLGSVTADQVREELNRRLKDSTVRTVLRRLEEKGYIAHSADERAFLYRPAQSRQRVAGRAAQRIVDWFCDGSVEALLVGMVDSKLLDHLELQRLAKLIATAQKKASTVTKEDQ